MLFKKKKKKTQGPVTLGYFFLIVIYIKIANARNTGRYQNKRKISSKIIFHPTLVSVLAAFQYEVGVSDFVLVAT